MDSPPRPSQRKRCGCFTLDGMNFAMGIWHGLVAIIILLAALKVFTDSGVPYRVELETMWKTVDFDLLRELYPPELPGMFNSTCDGTDYVLDPSKDVFDWFDCLNKYHGSYRDLDKFHEKMKNVTKNCRVNLENPVEEEGLGSMYQPVRTVLYDFKLWILLFAFEAITSWFHLMLWSRWWNTVYNELLKHKIQPFRWVEYSITSSVMLVCIFSLSKLLELYATLSLFFNSAFTQLGGGLAFEVCTYLQQEVIQRNEAGYERLVSVVGESEEGTKEERRPVGWIWPLSKRWRDETPMYRVLDTLRFSMLTLSWLTFALSYAAIFHAFYTIISPYYDLETGDLWKQLFWFIEVLNITILILYFSFPVLHTIQIWNRDWYVGIELGYLFASMFAKTFLVGIIFVAALQRHD